MAFLGYYLHWSREDLLNLEHAERRHWCEEVSEINRRIEDAEGAERPLQALV